MSYYFCKLVPPRDSFAQTLSEQEAAAMQAHAQYWKERAKENIPLAVGLVADPKGFYGVGILEVSDETQLKELLDHDPAITAGVGLHYEWYPIPRGVIHR
jgi:hypothetical protein